VLSFFGWHWHRIYAEFPQQRRHAYGGGDPDHADGYRATR